MGGFILEVELTSLNERFPLEGLVLTSGHFARLITRTGRVKTKELRGFEGIGTVAIGESLGLVETTGKATLHLKINR